MRQDPHIIYGRPYPQQYDAIVIGAGVGGLFCANLLAEAGMKVLLLERHYMLGGFCSTFRRHGYIFDAATHFLSAARESGDADRQDSAPPGD
jgi:phytoene dehydrogenase-like protein